MATPTMKETIDNLTATVAANEGVILALKTEQATALENIGANASAKLAELQAEVQAAKTALTVAQDALAAQVAEVVRVKDELSAVSGKLASAESKLANPAFAHASAEGVKPLKEVNSENGIETPEAFQARYDAEPDPVKKSLLWNERQARLQKKD